MGEARGIGGSLVRDKKAKKKVNSRKWARREVQGEAWSASHDDPSAAFAIALTRENYPSDIISTMYMHSSLTESLQAIIFCSLDLFYASTRICQIGGQSKYSAKSIQPVAK